MKKKTLTGLLICCTVLALFSASAFAADSSLPFKDVAESSWYYDAVDFVYDNDIMSGVTKTEFKPEGFATRAMFATALYRFDGKPEVTNDNTFTDVVAGSWYEKPVVWANGKGIVKGYGQDKFGPNDYVTREQIAAILYRYANCKGYDTEASADLSGYTDNGKISGYAVDAMEWANAEGIINGVSKTALNPKGIATRAQVAAIFYRFSEKFATVTVTFDLQGHGAAIDPLADVDRNSTIAAPAAPAAAGYTFGGWYKEAECINAWVFDTDTVTADITLYAKWTVISYTVAFANAEHGAVYDAETEGKTVSSISVASGSAVTVTGNKITVGDKDYYAIADSGYKFNGFGSVPATITAATTVTPVFEADTLADGYYLIYITDNTTINDTNSSMKLTEDASVPGQYKLDRTLNEGEKIKVVKVANNAITAWYPDGLDNEYVVDAAHAGDVTILFQTTYKEEWKEFGGYFTVQPKPVTEIKTIADVLATAKSDFPQTTSEDNTPDSDAWQASGTDSETGIPWTKYCCLTYDGNSLYFYCLEGKDISKNASVSQDSGNYVYTDGTITITFNMTEEVLSSIEFAGNDTWNGTYSPVSECIAAGTMISMPEGKQKAVEELEIGDVICTFDHETGEVSSAPVAFIWESKNAGNAFTLTFEDDVEVTVIEEHGFYDQEKQKYVFINLQNAAEYIGDHFYNADTKSWLALKSCEALKGSVDAYAIITSGHLNHMSNGMLSMCDGTVKMIANIFEYDDQMKFDADKKKADIEKYGLTSKEKILELEGFTDMDYDIYNLQYVDVMIGKGLITWEWMEALSDYCVANGL